MLVLLRSGRAPERSGGRQPPRPRGRPPLRCGSSPVRSPPRWSSSSPAELRRTVTVEGPRTAAPPRATSYSPSQPRAFVSSQPSSIHRPQVIAISIHGVLVVSYSSTAPLGWIADEQRLSSFSGQRSTPPLYFTKLLVFVAVADRRRMNYI